MTAILIILICIFVLMLWFFTLGVASYVTYVVYKKKFKHSTEEKLNAEEQKKKELERKYTENLYSYNGDNQA